MLFKNSSFATERVIYWHSISTDEQCGAKKSRYAWEAELSDNLLRRNAFSCQPL